MAGNPPLVPRVEADAAAAAAATPHLQVTGAAAAGVTLVAGAGRKFSWTEAEKAARCR